MSAKPSGGIGQAVSSGMHRQASADGELTQPSTAERTLLQTSSIPALPNGVTFNYININTRRLTTFNVLFADSDGGVTQVCLLAGKAMLF